MFLPKVSPDFFPSSLTGFFAASSGSKQPAFVGDEDAAKNASNDPLELSGISCSGVTRSQSVSI